MLGIFSINEPVTFPEGFLWGSATAGHQIEGNNIHSQKYHREIVQNFEEPSGKACDFWNLYKNDFELLTELKHQGFRMSVEWSRIEPVEGQYDEEALRKYLDMLENLKSRNIKVFVTLHHFTHPQWFEAKGGFRKRENIDFFIRHLEYLVPKIAQYVDNWHIFNEFNNGDRLEDYEMKANFLVAHARGTAVVREHSTAPVSTAHALVEWQPEDPDDEFDVTRTRIRDWIGNEFFFHAIRTGEILFPYRDGEIIPELKDSCDYWAINYYTRHFVTARKANGDAARHDCNHIKPIPRKFYLEEFYPEGLVDRLAHLRDLPVIITENGFCCDDDRFRIIYMARHFQALHEAIRRGSRIDGYLYWSFLDNYEWCSFVPRFGMVNVDFKTFKRTPKPSALFYREVIENNGFDKDMLLKYLPEFKDWKIYS
jgi:beta-glucosidase